MYKKRRQMMDCRAGQGRRLALVNALHNGIGEGGTQTEDEVRSFDKSTRAGDNDQDQGKAACA